MKNWDKNRMSQKMLSSKQVLGEIFLPSSNWPLQTGKVRLLSRRLLWLGPLRDEQNTNDVVGEAGT